MFTCPTDLGRTGFEVCVYCGDLLAVVVDAEDVVVCGHDGELYCSPEHARAGCCECYAESQED